MALSFAIDSDGWDSDQFKAVGLTALTGAVSGYYLVNEIGGVFAEETGRIIYGATIGDTSLELALSAEGGAIVSALTAVIGGVLNGQQPKDVFLSAGIAGGITYSSSLAASAIAPSIASSLVGTTLGELVGVSTLPWLAAANATLVANIIAPVIGMAVGVAVNFAISELFGSRKFGPGEFESLQQLMNSEFQVITGDDGRDILVAVSKDGTTIILSEGITTALGGVGHDTLAGVETADYINGGAGDDFLDGRIGDDVLLGGEGDDHLEGGDGNDYLHGGQDNDILYGRLGSDVLNGGKGDDFIHGGGQDDSIMGHDGEDLIFGGGGNDIIYGDINFTYQSELNKALTDDLIAIQIEEALEGLSGYVAPSDYVPKFEFSGFYQKLLNGTSGKTIGEFIDTLSDEILADDYADVQTQIVSIISEIILDRQAGASNYISDELANTLGVTVAQQINANGIYIHPGFGPLETGIAATLKNSVFDGQTFNQMASDLINGFKYDITLTPAELGAVKAELRDIIVDVFKAHHREFEVHFDETASQKMMEDITETVEVYDFDVPDGFVAPSIRTIALDLLHDYGSSVDILLERLLGNNDASFNDDIQTIIEQAILDNPREYETLENDGLKALSDDYIEGDGTRDDLIFGGDGDDFIKGQQGNDTIQGNAGDDTIYGGRENDVLVGGSGNDVLNGGVGDDTLHGGADNDIIQAGTGNDYAFGGDGDDFLSGDLGVDYLAGGSGDDVIVGEIGDDILLGEDGDDEISGGSGDDILSGGAGDDTLEGGAGNDTYFVTDGDGKDVIIDNDGNNNILFGDMLAEEAVLKSSGADLIIYTDAGHGLTEITVQDFWISRAIDRIVFADGKFKSLDGLDYIPEGEEIAFTGLNEGSPEILAIEARFGELEGDAADRLSPLSKNAYSTWGSDNYLTSVSIIDDTTTSYNAIEPFQTKHKRGTFGGHYNKWHKAYPDQLFETNDRVVGSWWSEHITGTVNDDAYFGHQGHDTIETGDGNDFVSAGGGSDTVNGGAGNDYILAGSGDMDVINGGDGNDTIFGGSGRDFVSEGISERGDDVIYGGDDSDHIYGRAGADLLFGDDGNDRIDGGQDSDVIVGGDGNDILIGRLGIHKGKGETGGTSEADQPDIIYGNAGDDWIYGNNNWEYFNPNGTADNYLNGGDGNDSIYVGGGNDTIYGGNDQDWIKGHGGDDYIHAGADNDVVFGGGGADIIFGGNELISEASNTGRNTGDATIFSLPSFKLYNDIIFGRAGSDTVYAGDGNDFISGDQYAPVGFSLDFGRIDKSKLSGDDLNLNDTLYGGQGNDDIFGGYGDDEIHGGAGNDFIRGQEDDDLLYGGRGSDYIRGGEGTDTASFMELKNVVGVTIETFLDAQKMSASGLLNITDFSYSSQYGHDEDANLTYSAVVTADFGDGVQEIDLLHTIEIYKGSTGNDTFKPGGLNEKFFGMDGDDRFVANTSNNYFDGGNGNDTVDYSHISAYGAYVHLFDSSGGISGVKTDQLFGIENIVGTQNSDNLHGDALNGNIIYGGSGDDNISGYGGNNFLYGEDGDDRVTGGNDSDTIDGGHGNDKLVGGDGNDVFIIVKDPGSTDTITDFRSGIDHIRLPAGVFANFAQALSAMSQNGDDTVIDLGDDQRLILSNVSMDTLQADDFAGLSSSAAAVQSTASQPWDGSVSYSVSAISGYGSGQDVSGGARLTDYGHGVSVQGNTWKKIDIGGYDVTDETYVTFEYKVGAQGEIQGIGFENDNNFMSGAHAFQLFGSDTSNAYFNRDYSYTGDGNWQRITLSLGAYQAGEHVQYLTLLNDDDAGASAQSAIRNLVFEERHAAIRFGGRAFSSYSGQDGSGHMDFYSGGTQIALRGNIWKSMAYDYEITDDTLITFEYKSDNAGELQGFALETDNGFANGPAVFQLSGTDHHANMVHDVLYTDIGQWQSMTVRAGDYAAGTHMTSLALFNDHDAGAQNSYSAYRNFQIYESKIPADVPVQSTTILVSPEHVDPLDLSSGTLSAYGQNQDAFTTVLQQSANAIAIEGNAWKKLSIDPYMVMDDTVLSFDIRTSAEAEIQGLGVDTNNALSPDWFFQIFGSADWGVQDYRAEADGQWHHVRVELGDVMAGEVISYLTLINDHDDGDQDGNVQFANVRLYEDDNGPLVDSVYHGTQGSDLFVIDALPGDGTVFEIEGFDITDGDGLDVSALLEGYGYDPISDAIGAFVSLGVQDDDVLVSIDTHTGESGFTPIAVIKDAQTILDDLSTDQKGLIG